MRDTRETPHERALDLRLREELRSTKDLIRPDVYSRVRPKPVWPDRMTDGRKPVAHGYIVGSSAESAAIAMDLVPTGHASRPFGEVLYVSGPKSKAAAAAERRADGLTARLDAQATRDERLRAFTANLQAAGTIVMGEMD